MILIIINLGKELNLMRTNHTSMIRRQPDKILFNPELQKPDQISKEHEGTLQHANNNNRGVLLMFQELLVVGVDLLGH